MAALAPVLSSGLATNLGSLSSTAHPIQVDSACFAGCVQLLANIFTTAAAGSSDGSGSGSDGSSGSGGGGVGGPLLDTGSLASAVLQTVCDGLQAMAVTGRVDSVTAAPVHVLPADAAPAAVAATARQAGSSPLSGPNPDSQPDIDVVIGSSAVSFKKADTAAVATAGTSPWPHSGVGNSSSSTSSSATPSMYSSVSLQYCQPVCLTAGKEQQLELVLQLGSSQLASTSQAPDVGVSPTAATGKGQTKPGLRCRLLLFCNGAAVVDDTVELQGIVR